MSFLRNHARGGDAARHSSSEEDIRASGFFQGPGDRGGIVLGSWRDRKGRSHLLRHKGSHHVLVVGPARSGKGVGVTVPTLLNWDDSALIYDTKGEHWAVTSGYRAQRLGQRVLKFDPTAPDSARFNPLDEIRRDHRMVDDVHALCARLIDLDRWNGGDHWARVTLRVLSAVVLFVLLTEFPEGVPGDRSLASVRSILFNGGSFREIAERVPRDGYLALLTYIRDRAVRYIAAPECAHREAWNTVAESMQTWLDMQPNTAGSVRALALSALAIFEDETIAENTRVSDFSIQSVVAGEEKTSLYVIVHPAQGDRGRLFSKLIMDFAIRRRIETKENAPRLEKGAGRLLLLIDDIASFGHLDEACFAAFQGCGVNLLALAQSRHQLRALKNDALIYNCVLQVAFSPNDYDTAEMFAARCGLTAQEVMRLPQNEAIVFLPFSPPIHFEKVKYFSDASMTEVSSCGTSAFTGRVS